MPGLNGGGEGNESKKSSSCIWQHIMEQKVRISAVSTNGMINCIVEICNRNKHNYCHMHCYCYLLITADKLLKVSVQWEVWWFWKTEVFFLVENKVINCWLVFSCSESHVFFLYWEASGTTTLIAAFSNLILLRLYFQHN